MLNVNAKGNQSKS